MSGGEVAGLVVAVFWAILVAFLAVVLVRLAQVLREAARLVSGVADEAVPLLGQAAETVRGASVQLERVDAITADVKEVTANASALSAAVSSAIGGPLVKLAALGYGLRRAAARQRAGALPARAVPAGRAPTGHRQPGGSAFLTRARGAIAAAPRAELVRGAAGLGARGRGEAARRAGLSRGRAGRGRAGARGSKG